MDYRFDESFLDDYDDLPESIQNKVEKRCTELAESFGRSTPGGWHVEKINEGFWTCRLNLKIRIFFSVNKTEIVYEHVGPHNMYKRL